VIESGQEKQGYTSQDKKDILCLENCKMWYGIRFCLGRIGKV